MQFEWDENKNESNIKKHGIDFTRAKEIFDGPVIERFDSRRFGEDRWQAIGAIDSETLFIVYVEKDENTYRIISARRAENHEQESYYKEIFG